MGWQDELRGQLAKLADDDYNGHFPFRWSSHICRTTAAVAKDLRDRVKCTNETEVAGVAAGRI